MHRIVGTHRFVYEVWGDTVNVARRLESSSLLDRIQLLESTSRQLGDRSNLEACSRIDIKGKDQMNTFFLN